ncbi:(2Fe-2S)-binding protein [Nocardiopsis valliformis]|uniref:(2Fe-2S)-binding protein n=1 Tax=Nocardiopsis valliformis TaxID=239974 RepID=UPI00034C64E0
MLAEALEDVGRVNMFFQVELHTGSESLGEGWEPVTVLDGADGKRVAEEVRRVRARLGALSGGGVQDVEWRVGASLFHQGLASRLLSPVLAVALCHGVRLRSTELLFDPGRSGPLTLRTAQKRAEPISAVPAEVAEWLDETVVESVLTGVETALAGVGRISPGLLRGNTAAALAGAARALGVARPEQHAEAEEVVRLMLERPSLSGTGHYTGTDRSGQAVFRRTTCCLYYRLPDGGLCGDCALRH